MQAIADAVEGSDIVAMDEIGPMELLSDNFKTAVKKAIDSDKMIIGVIHRNASDALVQSIKEREDAEITAVTLDNRDHLKEIVVREIIELIQPKQA